MFAKQEKLKVKTYMDVEDILRDRKLGYSSSLGNKTSQLCINEHQCAIAFTNHIFYFLS